MATVIEVCLLDGSVPAPGYIKRTQISSRAPAHACDNGPEHRGQVRGRVSGRRSGSALRAGRSVA